MTSRRVLQRRLFRSLVMVCALSTSGCSRGDPRTIGFHDADLVAFTEATAFDPGSFERWSLYVTRLSIGVSGMSGDFESAEIKRRVLARLDRDRASTRMRVMVLATQHYPEASTLLETGNVEPGSPMDDALLLSVIIQRHMASVSTEPDNQRDWERDVAALARNPVRMDRALATEYLPAADRSAPRESDLQEVRALKAERGIDAPGPAVVIGATPAFWDALIAAAATPRREARDAGDAGRSTPADQTPGHGVGDRSDRHASSDSGGRSGSDGVR